MKLGDLPLGILVALIGALIAGAAASFPAMAYFKYGPGFFPGLVGAGLIGCGLVLMAQGFAARHEQPWIAFADWVRNPRLVSNLLLILAAILFYLLASEWLGFLITGFIMFWVLISRLWGRPIAAIGIAFLATIVTQQAFVEFLQVPLPWGLLENWSGQLTWR